MEFVELLRPAVAGFERHSVSELWRLLKELRTIAKGGVKSFVSMVG